MSSRRFFSNIPQLAANNNCLCLLAHACVQMACGAPPHADMHPMRVLFLIPRDPPPSLEGPFSDTFKSFVATCLQVRCFVANACLLGYCCPLSCTVAVCLS
jgi:hypothetical protein